MKNNTKLKINLEKIMNIIIIIATIVSTLNLIIYIFKGSKSLLNSDSSFVVDFSLEQIRTGQIFPKNWINTNDFWIYSLIPGITLFLKMGFSLFLSRQISVFVQTIAILFLLIDLLKMQLKTKKDVLMIILIFLSGISGQFLFEVYGDATYGSIIFYMLLGLWLFIKYVMKEKKVYIFFLGILLTILTSFSLRFPIYLGSPLICYLLYYIYEKGINKKSMKAIITIIISIMIGFLINKFLSNNLLISSATSKEILSNSVQFSDAIYNTVFNYFWLCGTTGLNVFSLTVYYYNNFITSSSPLIILIFIKVIYAIFTISLPFVLIKKFKKFNEAEKIIYIFIISLLIIIMFFLIFGGMSSWYRYITPVLFFLNILYAQAYKYLFSNNKKNKIIFKFYVISCVFVSVFLGLFSYYDISNLKFKKNNYQEITNYLVSKDLKFGYVYSGNEHNIYRILSNNKLQVTRINSTGKEPFYWLNSKDWYSEKYYRGKVFFMRKKTEPKLEIENEAIKKYKNKDYVIFVFKDNNDFMKSTNG